MHSKSRPTQSEPARSLPGTRSADRAGQVNYVIMLRQPESAGNAAGRRAVYEANASLTSDFRSRLERWLVKGALDELVSGIGESMGFPMLTLTAAPAVGDMIKSAFPDEVASIITDTDDLGLIR
jgi:hypothetical protein